MVLHLELSVKRVDTVALVFLIFAGASGVAQCAVLSLCRERVVGPTRNQ